MQVCKQPWPLKSPTCQSPSTPTTARTYTYPPGPSTPRQLHLGPATSSRSPRKKRVRTEFEHAFHLKVRTPSTPTRTPSADGAEGLCGSQPSPTVGVFQVSTPTRPGSRKRTAHPEGVTTLMSIHPTSYSDEDDASDCLTPSRSWNNTSAKKLCLLGTVPDRCASPTPQPRVTQETDTVLPPVKRHRTFPQWPPMSPHRPGMSYATMIAEAILSSEEQRLTLSEIYVAISNKYPAYRLDGTVALSSDNDGPSDRRPGHHTGQQGWKNSIRHNLSLNKAFIKSDRKPCQKKGCFWSVDPSYIPGFLDVIKRGGRLVRRIASGESTTTEQYDDVADTPAQRSAPNTPKRRIQHRPNLTVLVPEDFDTAVRTAPRRLASSSLDLSGFEAQHTSQNGSEDTDADKISDQEGSLCPKTPQEPQAMMNSFRLRKKNKLPAATRSTAPRKAVPAQRHRSHSTSTLQKGPTSIHRTLSDTTLQPLGSTTSKCSSPSVALARSLSSSSSREADHDQWEYQPHADTFNCTLSSSLLEEPDTYSIDNTPVAAEEAAEENNLTGSPNSILSLLLKEVKDMPKGYLSDLLYAPGTILDDATSDITGEWSLGASDPFVGVFDPSDQGSSQTPISRRPMGHIRAQSDLSGVACIKPNNVIVYTSTSTPSTWEVAYARSSKAVSSMSSTPDLESPFLTEPDARRCGNHDVHSESDYESDADGDAADDVLNDVSTHSEGTFGDSALGKALLWNQSQELDVPVGLGIDGGVFEDLLW
ncbi:hypothetical protein BZG36_03557 [Bifiguratus adelaidae]|uniref:Fork-head domain-containing protein n=1 Tax=Bifiguratus adelaidae TaxID=1938954 RepID=A0A261Y0A7_9FUNG|nr:hypothetical protein BZG36_03557 [Bifiguratus adelaidae]